MCPGAAGMGGAAGAARSESAGGWDALAFTAETALFLAALPSPLPSPPPSPLPSPLAEVVLVSAIASPCP